MVKFVFLDVAFHLMHANILLYTVFKVDIVTCSGNSFTVLLSETDHHASYLF